MIKFISQNFILLFVTGLMLLFVAFTAMIHQNTFTHDADRFEKIKRAGIIRMITNKSINSYHYYNGRPTGFEFDLALEFAKFLNLDLDIITPGWNNMFPYLEQGKGDFIASSLAITAERLEQVNFSLPYMTIRQHIIHHKLTFGPKNNDDLTFRTIHVRRGTSYHSRLEEIKSQGINFKYILHDNVPTEELIRMVQKREVKFTVADNNIALLNQRYHPDIRIGIPLQEKEPLAWAVDKNDPKMLELINKFFLHANRTGLLQQIIDKYYANIEKTDSFDIKKFHQRIETRLPKYKKILMEQSATYGFDWRLVAAVVYQESHFNPNAISFTNVRGLMQVTTATAREMGINNRLDPNQSITAGIKYLDKMIKKFPHIENEYDRMLFALASYNVGYGHVLDAVKIAKGKGLDTTRWKNIKKTLPLLSKTKYYTKAKHGYARGWEPVKYVEHILTYYDILKKKKI